MKIIDYIIKSTRGENMILTLEKYLMITCFIAVFIFIIYFIYKTFKRMSSSAPVDKFLRELSDNDQSLFKQVGMDYRDGKLPYIFDELDNIDIDIYHHPEEGICICLEGFYNYSHSIVFSERNITYCYYDDEDNEFETEITYDFSSKEEMYDYIHKMIKEQK